MNADFIIGLHGAGFANTIFSKPKTRILELKANTAGDAIKNLVEKNQLIYNHLSFENKNFDFNDQNGDIEVDINLLGKKFMKLYLSKNIMFLFKQKKDISFYCG